MSTFTDEQGRVFQMNPLTGGYTQTGTTAGGAGSPRPTGQEYLQSFLGRGKEVASQVGQTVSTGVEKLQTKYPNLGGYARGGLALAGALPAAGTAMEELEAGRPTGALAALAPAGLSALGAGMVGRTGQAMIGKGGPVGTAVGLGLMGLGALLPGAAASGAESVRQKATGEPTKGKEQEFSTQMAMAKQMGELGATQYRDQMGTYTSAIRDLQRDFSNQQYLDLQRNLPLINQMKNADLVRQQALINTQGQQYAMLGTVATAGQLATGAQAETGATLRTALTSNPYAGSTLQAPQIRFG